MFAIASIWQLAAMVVAIRQALDYTSTWRAVGVAVVGFSPYAVVSSLVYALVWLVQSDKNPLKHRMPCA